MRHHNKNRKFGREKNQRRALLKSLARNLVIKGKILTSEAKAKEIRPIVEKMVTRGKAATLTNRRMLVSALGGADTASRLIKIAQGYQGRSGGYLRIVKMGPRKSDAAKMAVIEFV